jgi:hypothetical protein
MTDKIPYIELEAQHDALTKRYDSLVLAIQKIELVNGDLVQRNNFLEEQLENAQLNVSQQKQTMINVVTESNRVKDEMAAEISDLKSKLKAAENGNNNRLGN